MDKKRTTKHPGRERPQAFAPGKVFVSPRQLAERWECSQTTAQRIAQKAGIPKYCLGEGRNGMVRYALADVEGFEQSRRGPAPSV